MSRTAKTKQVHSPLTCESVKGSTDLQQLRKSKWNSTEYRNHKGAPIMQNDPYSITHRRSSQARGTQGQRKTY